MYEGVCIYIYMSFLFQLGFTIVFVYGPRSIHIG